MELTRQYLRPTYPGQLHTVRKNTWNVIMVFDLSLSTSLEVVTQQVAQMVQRGIPLRFGVVPMFDSEVNDICEFRNKSVAHH
jgi:UDP-glucose:glycoprotein glucosyltransferase